MYMSGSTLHRYSHIVDERVADNVMSLNVLGTVMYYVCTNMHMHVCARARAHTHTHTHVQRMCYMHVYGKGVNCYSCLCDYSIF